MTFENKDLDLILVPAGLLIMFAYHLFLLYRVLRYPATTVIGYDNNNWMAWAQTMMQGDTTHINIALSVMSSNSSGSIYLATMCLSLCAFVGVWVGNGGTNPVNSVYILGDRSSATNSLKDIGMLFTFMISFGAFIQSTKYYIQVNSLVSMPDTDVPVTYVQNALLGGNNFWEIGLRVLYFAMALLFWSFGPIPMFVCCVIMVVVLAFVDFNSTPLHSYQPRAKLSAKKMTAAVKAAEHGRDQKSASTVSQDFGI
ncbi:hypothetical protein NE237_031569 [Protea cynaroides]|uniref:Uncharacterized protein n=1 Tax=Protea cynaroides TaxID=273540 RepID=A0A9Q0L1P3_9MAGN|nr:hypothetical protein NE237_031569 [Protea cynaroides]